MSSRHRMIFPTSIRGSSASVPVASSPAFLASQCARGSCSPRPTPTSSAGLSASAGLLGPVAGIMVCDYFLIRKTELDVNSLYHREGAYHYTKGINPRAIVALALGVGLALVGLFVKPLHFLYDYAWFVGFFTAGLLYMVDLER